MFLVLSSPMTRTHEHLAKHILQREENRLSGGELWTFRRDERFPVQSISVCALSCNNFCGFPIHSVSQLILEHGDLGGRYKCMGCGNRRKRERILERAVASGGWAENERKNWTGGHQAQWRA